MNKKKNLHFLLTQGTHKARTLRRAHTLIQSDKGKIDREIAEILQCPEVTVQLTRKRFSLEGLESALSEKPRPGGKKKFTPKEEAHLIALACSDPPEERTQWSIRLLTEKIVELGVDVSRETVRRTLKKTRSNRGKKGIGALGR